MLLMDASLNLDIGVQSIQILHIVYTPTWLLTDMLLLPTTFPSSPSYKTNVSQLCRLSFSLTR